MLIPQVSVLEHSGYLEMITDDADGRGRLVQLTERGERAHEMIMKIFTNLERDLSHQLGASRHTELRDMLQSLAATPDRAIRSFNQAVTEFDAS